MTEAAKVIADLLDQTGEADLVDSLVRDFGLQRQNARALVQRLAAVAKKRPPGPETPFTTIDAEGVSVQFERMDVDHWWLRIGGACFDITSTAAITVRRQGQ